MRRVIKKTAVAGFILFVCLNVGAFAAVDDAPAPKKQWQYTPEEFGMGRKHTPNDKCNQDVDKLLEELRACYNAHEAAKCGELHDKNWRQIGEIKKQRRCRK